MSAYQELIALITDGMAVNASNANRPLNQIQSNVAYLKELLETALAGATVIARDRTVDTSVQIGQPVYFNSSTQQFEKALAGVTTDSQGLLATSSTTLVWGIVKTKTASNKADILLSGVADINLSAAVDGTISAGLYYLSTTNAGKLVSSAPAVPVPVCLVAGDGATSGTKEVLVQTDFRDVIDAHRHYSFDLQCTQAGDSSEEGWLAAADASFEGNAPSGAVYGYNIAQSSFSGLWPPLPATAAYLEWNKGDDLEALGGGAPSGTGSDALVRFDSNGIWWMSDCAEDAPFVASSVSESSSCSRVPAMSMKLFFTKPVLWSADTAVLSLQAATGSGLTITCQGGTDAADTGHLQIDLDLSFVSGDTDKTGSLAVKTIEGETLHFGRVVEGIRAGTPNVTLASDLGAIVGGLAQGVVTISVDSSLGGSELDVTTVRLDGATEEYYQDVIAIGFSDDFASEYRGRLDVPGKTELPAGTKLKLRFRLMGRASGVIPSDLFTLTYRRIPAPSALLTPVALPLVDTALTLDPGVTLTAANQYYDVDSEEFTIAAGDIVLFTLARAGSDGYAAEIHVLQQHGIIV